MDAKQSHILALLFIIISNIFSLVTLYITTNDTTILFVASVVDLSITCVVLFLYSVAKQTNEHITRVTQA